MAACFSGDKGVRYCWLQNTIDLFGLDFFFQRQDPRFQNNSFGDVVGMKIFWQPGWKLSVESQGGFCKQVRWGRQAQRHAGPLKGANSKGLCGFQWLADEPSGWQELWEFEFWQKAQLNFMTHAHPWFVRSFAFNLWFTPRDCEQAWKLSNVCLLSAWSQKCVASAQYCIDFQKSRPRQLLFIRTSVVSRHCFTSARQATAGLRAVPTEKASAVLETVTSLAKLDLLKSTYSQQSHQTARGNHRICDNTKIQRGWSSWKIPFVLPHWYLSLLGGFTQTKKPGSIRFLGFLDEVRATLQTSGYRFQDDAWNAMEIHLTQR